MKRILVLLVVLSLAFAAFACTPHTVQGFTIESGRAAFAQLDDPTLPREVVRSIRLPAGTSFVADWGDMGVLVSQAFGEEGTITRYGVWRDDAYVLPCEYRRLEVVGDFYLTQYHLLDERKVEVFDRTGTLLVGTADTSAGVVAVSSDYFVFYTDTDAQLFDSEGNAYFLDGVLRSGDRVSVCGDYVVTIDATGSSLCIWDGSNILRHRFSADDTRYVMAYVGDRFLVTAISAGTEKNYTYIEEQDGQTYYMRQQAWWYDPVTDVTVKADLDYVVLSVRNAYTPAVSREEVAAMHLRTGYSAVVVAELDERKVHVSDRYYVMDSEARLVVRYPVGINPTAIYYRADRGFVGSSHTASAAALYDLAGNLIWQDKSHTYATMRWQGDRLTASYYEDGVTHHGAFDSEGNVAVPFDYRYMSPYFEGLAVAGDADTYYVLDAAGKVLSTIDVACPEHWLGYGLYTYRQGDYTGVKNFAGQVVVAPTSQTITSIGITVDGSTYLICQEGDTQTVLVLK